MTMQRSTVSLYAAEVSSGDRFEFGKNWARFLRVLDDGRIRQAEQSLREMLELTRLDGMTFLDVGSGSGLFSMVAARLGARVHSFDFDPESVACTRYLKERYAPTSQWVIEQGSVLDRTYIKRLNQFDVVYSWGVLHHTGAMWEALDNTVSLVKEGGKLFIAIYNDQGGMSRRWKAIKRLYNKAPRIIRPLICVPVMTACEGRAMLGRALKGRNPLEAWTDQKTFRGMSKWHNWIDWIGGYPFEVAKPEEIFDFCRKHGFTLAKLKSQGVSHGCNEFVFDKHPSKGSS